VRDINSNSVDKNVTCSSTFKNAFALQLSVQIIRILIFHKLETLISQRLTPSLGLKHLYNSSHFVGFEVFTVMVMKSINFWDMTPCACQLGRLYHKSIWYCLYSVYLYHQQVFEDRALRRIFAPEREEVTGRRKVYNEELHNL
jgi:hypothetical protein